MGRIFIKNEIISRVISIRKNKVNGKYENVYQIYSIMIKQVFQLSVVKKYVILKNQK